MSQVYNDRYDLTADGTFGIFSAQGDFTLSVTGTFGGGTVTLQRKGLDGTWRDVPGAAYTTPVEQTFTYPDKTRNQFRAVLSGSTSPAVHIDWLN